MAGIVLGGIGALLGGVFIVPAGFAAVGLGALGPVAGGMFAGL